MSLDRKRGNFLFLLPLLLLQICVFMQIPNNAVQPIPFNKFPGTAAGIERLGQRALDEYRAQLDLLGEQARDMEQKQQQQKAEVEPSSLVRIEAKQHQLGRVLAKNGFRDEAQFEYIRHLVKWEREKRERLKLGHRSINEEEIMKMLT